MSFSVTVGAYGRINSHEYRENLLEAQAVVGVLTQLGINSVVVYCTARHPIHTPHEHALTIARIMGADSSVQLAISVYGGVAHPRYDLCPLRGRVEDDNSVLPVAQLAIQMHAQRVAAG